VSDSPEAATAVRPASGRIGSRAYVLFSIVITIVSCLINIGGINGSEVIDDHDLLHSPFARGCGRNPVDCFRHPQFGLYYRPIMGASFSVGENLHGQSPLPFHVENLALHGLVMLEACWAFRLLLSRDSAALLAGLLYGIHPLQVPVTTFIGGRTDTLALVFALMFTISAVKGSRGSRKALWRLLSVIAFGITIFCKEQCVPLLLLVPLLAYREARSEPGESKRGILRPWMLLYLVPVALLLVAAHRVIPPQAIDTVAWRPTQTRVAWTLGLRIEMVGRTLWFYVKSYLWPTIHTLHASSLGPWDVPQPLTALGGFFGAGIWIAVTAHSWPDRKLRALSLWTALMLVPCLNIVPIPSQFVACYRAAIPLFGIAGLAGALCDRAIEATTRRAQYVTALVGISGVYGILAILSLADVPMWQSDYVLTWTEFQADNNFLPALAGHAAAQRRAGLRREAIESNNRVVERLFPGRTSLAERIAIIDSPWMLRNVKSQSSLRYQPRPFVSYVMRERGGGQQELGLLLPAIEDYRLALAVLPKDYEVADALVRCCQLSGKYEDARAVLAPVAAQAPTVARLQMLGSIELHLGRWVDARSHLSQALALAERERNTRSIDILKAYLRSVEAALSVPAGPSER
jgi:tetratricopeptide (TPR) repeat protein